MKWGLISLNGSFNNLEALNRQLEKYVDKTDIEVVLGVDGGCELLHKLKIDATEILGDFDSIFNLEQYTTLWPYAKVHTFPVEKDFTDAELAFNLIHHHQLDRVVVVGGLGGRADHMLSVLFLLAREDNFILIDEQNYIEKIEGPFVNQIQKEENQQTYISLIPLNEGLSGITLEGFKYPLSDATIKFSETLGISNELVDHAGLIKIAQGKGYLVISKDIPRK